MGYNYELNTDDFKMLSIAMRAIYFWQVNTIVILSIILCKQIVEQS